MRNDRQDRVAGFPPGTDLPAEWLGERDSPCCWPDKLLFIKVHNSRLYADVIDVIDIARGAGVKVFGIAPPTAEEAAAAKPPA